MQGSHFCTLCSGTSCINVALAPLGVPLAVSCDVGTFPSVESGLYGLSVLNHEYMSTDALCMELFDGSGIDIGCIIWRLGGVKHWELQVVYATETTEADNLQALLEASHSMHAPFVGMCSRS